MTLNEFNMWLDGFKESIDEAPTKVQWKKIQSKLAEVVPLSFPFNPVPYPYQPSWSGWVTVEIPQTDTRTVTTTPGGTVPVN